MFAYQNLARNQEITEADLVLPQSPSEKVLTLALNLPHTRNKLEQEAVRVEGLLDGIAGPRSDSGAELIDQLVEVLEHQLEGIYGLLDGENTDDFDWGCQVLVQSNEMLKDLEQRLEELSDTVPLVA